MNESQTVKYVYDLKTNLFNLKDKKKLNFVFFLVFDVLFILFFLLWDFIFFFYITHTILII